MQVTPMYFSKSATVIAISYMICVILIGFIKPDQISQLEQMQTTEDILDEVYFVLNCDWNCQGANAWTTSWYEQDIAGINYPTTIGEFSFELTYEADSGVLYQTKTRFIPSFARVLALLIITVLVHLVVHFAPKFTRSDASRHPYFET